MRHFVSGSSIILAGWLAVTFFYDVPAQRYLSPGKNQTATMKDSPAATSQADAEEEPGALAASVSR